MAGFYVPDSQSWSYVANKRDTEGNYIYDDTNINLEKQAALQSLEKDYSQVIENAYANYLAANNNLRASTMGQGYKELYKQMQEKELVGNIEQIGSSAAQARQQIEQNAAAATEEMQSAFKSEVGYFDRLAKSFNEYLGYVKGLTNVDNAEESYLQTITGLTSDEIANLRYDQMYDILTSEANNQIIQNYQDVNKATGKTFLEWQRENLKDTTSDLAYAQWLYDYNTSGKTGYQEFLSMPKETKQLNRDEVLKEKADEREKILNELSDLYWKRQIESSSNSTTDIKTSEEFMREAMKKYDISSEELYNYTLKKYNKEVSKLKTEQPDRLNNAKNANSNTSDWKVSNKITNDTWLSPDGTKYQVKWGAKNNSLKLKLNKGVSYNNGDIFKYDKKEYMYYNGDIYEVRRV